VSVAQVEAVCADAFPAAPVKARAAVRARSDFVGDMGIFPFVLVSA